MALCINDSGTWREISTQCVNDSGTWREVVTGCINESGTWREFGFAPALGSEYEGGYLICQASGFQWIVAPSSSEVVRTWNSREDAVTTAQQVSGCTGWFVPSCGQLKNPGATCNIYWDSYQATRYWSSTERYDEFAWSVYVNGGSASQTRKSSGMFVRAFRTVTY
jgi:hypothetical protein